MLGMWCFIAGEVGCKGGEDVLEREGNEDGGPGVVGRGSADD